jgi:hypothetical protein
MTIESKKHDLTIVHEGFHSKCLKVSGKGSWRMMIWSFGTNQEEDNWV